MSMKIDTLPIGLYEENVYLLHDHGQVLIIDPGRNANYIKKYIRDSETVAAVFLTHGHNDHIEAADDLADLFACDIYLHHADWQLTDPAKVDRYMFSFPLYHQLKDYQEVTEIGVFKTKIYHTPGHTAGSVCIQYRNVLFSGDTLFAGSIGRTDLYSGNEAEMQNSLERLKLLPADLAVYPGHGPATSIGLEKMVNPYLW